MYPDEIDDCLLETMANCHKVLPYFDIPIQHANDRLLKIMNRRGSKELISQRIHKIRSMFAEPILRTTIIVGFPSETLDEFNEMLEFIKESKWDRLGAFTYSQEEDTPSYEMEDDVDEAEKARRLNELMDIQTSLQEEINQHLIGKQQEVLVENYDGLTKMYHGRSKYSAPDGIDGEVLFKCDHELKMGSFVEVRIKKIKKHDLIAEYIREVE